MFQHVLDNLDDAALDALPFGVVVLDEQGRVVRYNQAEARRANVSRWAVIGRDFVRELGWTLGATAPMRLRTFLEGGAGGSFRAGGVTVTMRRRPGGAWLLVEPVAAELARHAG